jgi:hypothetical protein
MRTDQRKAGFGAKDFAGTDVPPISGTGHGGSTAWETLNEATIAAEIDH